MLLSYWYEKCMPKIKEIEPNISKELSKFKNIDGVKSIYVWGSYAHNINDRDFRVRDIDVLAKTKFDSGDLLAIDDKIIKANYDNEYLENQGYEPRAIKFSKKFLTLSKCNVDCWTISSDRKLLHWGPITINKVESHNVNKKAEDYANRYSGTTRKKINKSSERHRKNWFNHYVRYVDSCFEGMPTGWYKTEDIKIKDIISQAIKI